MNRLSTATLLCGLVCGFSLAANAAPEKPVFLELLSDKSAANPGSTFRVSVKAKIAPGWHIYWSNPGETGLPTLIKWQVPKGCSVSATHYPVPNRYVQKITDNLSMVSHTFEGEVFFTADVTIPPSIEAGKEVIVSADVDWQACKEICTPPTTTLLNISVPVRAEEVDSSSAQAILMAWRKGQGAAPQIKVSVVKTDDALQLKGVIPTGAKPPTPEALFLPTSSGLVPENGQQTLHIDKDSLTLTVPLNDKALLPTALTGFLINGDGTAFWLTTEDTEKAGQTDEPGDAQTNNNVSTDPNIDKKVQEQIDLIRSWGLISSQSSEDIDSKSEKGLLLFMLLALAGGVILNLMPCVFPILGIKIMGFVKQAGDDSAAIRKHGWAFTLGVILSLWSLVSFLYIVRQYGASAGWGFQLQEPGFVLFMILLMFVFALNLCGLFEFGTSLVGVGTQLQSKNGLGGAFFSGVLAVLVATPCTGPFMAPALGYALSKPFPLAMLVFTMLAIGLALPYLLLSYFPFLIRKLPRPGAWMETFKQFMSFPMFATAIWLLWIFSAQTNQEALIIVLAAMLIGALGLWIYGKYTMPTVTVWKKRFAQTVSGALVITMVVMGGIASRQAPIVVSGKTVEKYGISWEAFDTGRIIDLREQGKTIFIDFTAKW
jgi:thiol:disulfide interchange protein DsbD